MLNDISKDFVWNPYDTKIGRRLAELDKTPDAIRFFAESQDGLSHYGYWFLLSTLWVSHTEGADLEKWRQLFSSDRAKRQTSIMKPSELAKFKQLPHFITVYRAHHPGETDWISFTLDKEIALRFARERGKQTIGEYKIKKRDVLALFLRRGEQEILMLDKSKAQFVRIHGEGL